MSAADMLTERLTKLSIKPSASVSHAPQTSPAEWRSVLTNASGAPKEFELLKTLVFKPKTAKSATTVPVVVVAREEAEAGAAALGKKLNLKEMRLANADLLKEFFALDKDSCMSRSHCYFHSISDIKIVSPLAIESSNFSKVVTVLDSTLASAPVPFAVHASSPESTIFLSGSDIASYLRSLETEETKMQEIDFTALKTESAAPAPAAGASKTAQLDKQIKEDAKIEGAVQIAIGVKKEVDFPTWYTNVSLSALFLFNPEPELFPGPHKSRHARLLQRQRLLHPQTMVLLHLGSNSRVVQRQDQGDGGRKRILPHVRIFESIGTRERPHRRLLPGGRLGYSRRTVRARGAHCHPSNIRDGDVPLLRKMD